MTDRPSRPAPSDPEPAAGAEFTGHLPGSREYGRITLALFLAGLAVFALLYSTQPVLPELARDFGLSSGSAALSVSVSTLALGVTLLLIGPLTEAVGRTPVMHTSLAVSTLVGLATALAPSWPLLLVLRAVQGAALAGLSAVALAYLKDEVHPSAHARASGLYVGGTALGGMSGRLVAGWVADLTNWRVAVAAIGVVALACTLAVRVLLPPSQGFRPQPARPAVVLRSMGRAVADPLMLGNYLIAFFAMGAFVATYNALGFRLAAQPYSLGVGSASLVFLAYAFGSAASTYAGRLADRYSRRVVVVGALVVFIAGLLLTLAGPLWSVCIAVAVATIGFFAAHGVASGWVGARSSVAGAGAGQASALYLFFYYLGSSVCGTLGADLWGPSGWAPVAGFVVAAAGLAFLVALGMAALVRTGRVATIAGSATDHPVGG